MKDLIRFIRAMFQPSGDLIRHAGDFYGDRTITESVRGRIAS